MFRPSEEWGTKEEDALVAYVELGIRFSSFGNLSVCLFYSLDFILQI